MSGPGVTTAMPEALRMKGDIMVCLSLVLGVLERAMGADKRERAGKEERKDRWWRPKKIVDD